MRYEDWDVLLFPKDSKIPMKEFKTNCHVVHDTEFAYTHGSYGLPTMTCFMPGLSPSTSFNISLHCWKTPDISQFTRNYSKHPELVKFEARVLIDGRLVASSSFNRNGPWPQLINHSFEFTKNGELEILKFPQFRSELLRQSYWSPADELGRIKVVISEGFPRDSLTVPIERVKNIIAFSFQHAPLGTQSILHAAVSSFKLTLTPLIDILESSGIAWPNPAMWRRGPFNPTMPVPAQQHEDGPDAHIHSPRRRASLMKGASSSSGYAQGPPGLAQVNAAGVFSSMPNTQALLQRSGAATSSGYTDPFNQQKSEATAYLDWASTFGPVGYNQAPDTAKPSYNPASGRKATVNSKVSNSDTSMFDYSLGSSNNAHHMSEFQTMSFPATNPEDPDAGVVAPKAPTNTPTTLLDSSFVDDIGIDVNKAGTPGSTSTFSAPYINAISTYQQPRMKLAAADKPSITDTPPTDEFFNSNTNFSSELATSLTHSLLNQPHPLPVQTANIPMPACEVKSRKENRLNNDTPAENTPTAEHTEMRKVSQSAFGNLGNESRGEGTNNSPSSQRTFSGVFSQRSTSAGDFGNDLTNVSNVFMYPNAESNMVSNLGAEARIGSGSEKGAKRTRHFTPASAKAIDDEDEPRRSSPRVRSGLGDQLAETS